MVAATVEVTSGVDKVVEGVKAGLSRSRRSGGEEKEIKVRKSLRLPTESESMELVRTRALRSSDEGWVTLEGENGVARSLLMTEEMLCLLCLPMVLAMF